MGDPNSINIHVFAQGLSLQSKSCLMSKASKHCLFSFSERKHFFFLFSYQYSQKLKLFGNGSNNINQATPPSRATPS